MRSVRLLLFALLAGGCGFLMLIPNQRVNAVHHWNEYKLWATYWSIQEGFSSTLELKNNRIEDTLQVRVSLYGMAGQEQYLQPITIAPRQTIVVDLNSVLSSLPRNLRARLGQEGAIEVDFEGPNPSALMGGVTVRNARRRTAWNFFLYPERPGLDAVPLEGIFWFPDQNTEGFVAIQNISYQQVTLTPRIQVGGSNHDLEMIALGPGQPFKLDVRQALRKLGLHDVSAGGVELSYIGAPDALRAHGVLFNGRGFSAEVDFVRANSAPDGATFAYRTARFAIGAPDPALGLARAIRFEPTLILHNFNGSAIDVELLFGYREGASTAHLRIPLSVASGRTAVVPLRQHLRRKIPRETPWASLQLSYSNTRSGLGMALVSVSADGQHSIRSVLNWTQASVREGWYWQVDDNTNTLVSILNSDGEPARVAFSIDYSLGQSKYSYDLPEITVEPHVSEMINMGDVIAAGLPDSRWRCDSSRRNIRRLSCTQNRAADRRQHLHRGFDYGPTPCDLAYNLQHSLLRVRVARA